MISWPTTGLGSKSARRTSALITTNSVAIITGKAEFWNGALKFQCVTMDNVRALHHKIHGTSFAICGQVHIAELTHPTINFLDMASTTKRVQEATNACDC